MPENQHCAACGMLIEPAGEYHPWAVCALKKAGYDNATIKANVGAVLNHGRRLERQGLPNDAPISAVKF